MILVTSSTGPVGTELVMRLLAAGERVRVLVRNTPWAAHFPGEVERYLGDLDKPETMTAAFDGVRIVYLISHSSHVQPLVELAERAQVERIVRQSTLAAGFDATARSGHSEREADRAIERSSLAYTILRPTIMMHSTLFWWASDVRTRRLVNCLGGAGRLSPVEPRDVAAVASAVITQAGHEGRVYDITGPQLLSLSEMVAIIARIVQQDICYIDAPETAATEVMTKLRMRLELVIALLETMADVRMNRFAHIADTVPLITGRAGRTYDDWCSGHIGAFTPIVDSSE